MHWSFVGKLIDNKHDWFERRISLISGQEFISEFCQVLGISALIGAAKRKRRGKRSILRKQFRFFAIYNNICMLARSFDTLDALYTRRCGSTMRPQLVENWAEMAEMRGKMIEWTQTTSVFFLHCITTYVCWRVASTDFMPLKDPGAGQRCVLS